MGQRPLFSIIIPTFNRPASLPWAIKSVIAQDYTDWELIIVDDGSTDETRTVVEPFLSDARIRYHWQENRELNGARNTGIRLAQGTYLGFLDDDDHYQENHLAILAAYLKQTKEPVAAVRTAMYLQASEKRFIPTPLLNIIDTHPAKALWETPVNLLSFVFHHEIFQQHTFDESFILAEDFHFLIRVFLHYSVVQLADYTVVYQQHDSRRSNRYFQPPQLENKIAALRATWETNQELLERHVSRADLKHKITQAYLHFAKAAFRSQDKALGWLYFRQSLYRKDWPQYKAYLRTFFIGIWGDN